MQKIEHYITLRKGCFSFLLLCILLGFNEAATSIGVLAKGLVELGYAASCPSIAQLVERWTVVVLTSIGRWFESGSKDHFFPPNTAIQPKPSPYISTFSLSIVLGNVC